MADSSDAGISRVLSAEVVQFYAAIRPPRNTRAKGIPTRALRFPRGTNDSCYVATAVCELIPFQLPR
jgi:hypothetical protein